MVNPRPLFAADSSLFNRDISAISGFLSVVSNSLLSLEGNKTPKEHILFYQ